MKNTELHYSTNYRGGTLMAHVQGYLFPVTDAKKLYLLENGRSFLHEAITGHHYQISLQQNNNDIQEFRK
jgi:uncharacterized protein (DUF885 family)